jgi:hypothetical protein
MSNITREWRDATFCPDCAMVIANGDTSGIDNPDEHLAKMDEHLAGVSVALGLTDGGFRTETCDGCGIETATDQWFDGQMLVTVETFKLSELPAGHELLY